MSGRNTKVTPVGVHDIGTYGLQNIDFLYQASTTKPDAYNVGDRVTLPDGREFRLAKAAATCDPECGAYNATVTIANAVAPAQATGAGTVGSYYVTITVGSGSGELGTGAIAADGLCGAYIVIGNGTSQHPQMRQIVGNPVKTSGAGSLTVHLDAALTTAVTVGTTNIETAVNPYGYMTGGLTTPSDYATFKGVPAARATVGQYFYLQTKGPCWLTSDGNTCNSAQDRTLVFVANGSVVSSNDVTMESGFQIAGKAIDTSTGSGSSNAPFVDLDL